MSPEWAERLSKMNRDASGRWVPDDPTPVTAPPVSVPDWMVNPRYRSFPDDGVVPVRVHDLKPCDGKVTLDERIPSANPCALGMGHRGTHLTLSGGALVGYLYAGNPIPVPEGEGPIAFVAEDLGEGWGAPSMPAMDAVRANIEDVYARSGLVAPAASYPFLVSPEVPGADAEPGSVRRGGTARVQPLGTDGEPVGNAKDYPLAEPVEITEKEWVDPDEDCFCGLSMADCEAHRASAGGTPVIAATASRYVGPTAEELYDRPAQEACGAGTVDSLCMYVKGHEGLHHFEKGPFNRV